VRGEEDVEGDSGVEVGRKGPGVARQTGGRGHHMHVETWDGPCFVRDGGFAFDVGGGWESMGEVEEGEEGWDDMSEHSGRVVLDVVLVLEH
jgi:hypothetical protein